MPNYSLYAVVFDFFLVVLMNCRFCFLSFFLHRLIKSSSLLFLSYNLFLSQYHSIFGLLIPPQTSVSFFRHIHSEMTSPPSSSSFSLSDKQLCLDMKQRMTDRQAAGNTSHLLSSWQLKPFKSVRMGAAGRQTGGLISLQHLYLVHGAIYGFIAA